MTAATKIDDVKINDWVKVMRDQWVLGNVRDIKGDQMQVELNNKYMYWVQKDKIDACPREVIDIFEYDTEEDDDDLKSMDADDMKTAGALVTSNSRDNDNTCVESKTSSSTGITTAPVAMQELLQSNDGANKAAQPALVDHDDEATIDSEATISEMDASDIKQRNSDGDHDVNPVRDEPCVELETIPPRIYIDIESDSLSPPQSPYLHSCSQTSSLAFPRPPTFAELDAEIAELEENNAVIRKRARAHQDISVLDDVAIDSRPPPKKQRKLAPISTPTTTTTTNIASDIDGNDSNVQKRAFSLLHIFALCIQNEFVKMLKLRNDRYQMRLSVVAEIIGLDPNVDDDYKLVETAAKEVMRRPDRWPQFELFIFSSGYVEITRKQKFASLVSLTDLGEQIEELQPDVSELCVVDMANYADFFLMDTVTTIMEQLIENRTYNKLRSLPLLQYVCVRPLSFKFDDNQYTILPPLFDENKSMESSAKMCSALFALLATDIFSAVPIYLENVMIDRVGMKKLKRDKYISIEKNNKLFQGQTQSKWYLVDIRCELRSD
eukprot:CAMPEP_0202732372 /NCGR_PEP_ID=MMETSP1385-20130828/187624_1 /ASSEMBLY_ACC=CAM_ASM_000861 /TAXON_ID=933848 /ORGANISM="Elphidium margaritaceum" /LENGTH=550 /DNA_ID=CAMNT_0049398681 /DNA_START=54 /DNA_END=1706 /DNA_ORIENTATION=+